MIQETVLENISPKEAWRRVARIAHRLQAENFHHGFYRDPRFEYYYRFEIRAYLEGRIKATVYIGFNVGGDGLNRDEETQKRYSATMPLARAIDYVGRDAVENWKQLGAKNALDYLRKHLQYVEDEDAKAALSYWLNNNMINPTSVHVKIVPDYNTPDYNTPITLTAEERNKLKQLKEKYFPTPEQKKKEENIKIKVTFSFNSTSKVNTTKRNH